MVFLTRALRSAANNSSLKEMYYRMQGFGKYGLLQDDFYDYTDAVHLEAVRRLPPELYDQQRYRIIRANQLEITKRYLPEDQQISYEEAQTKGNYLQPYLERVKREKAEKEEWVKFLTKN